MAHRCLFSTPRIASRPWPRSALAALILLICASHAIAWQGQSGRNPSAPPSTGQAANRPDEALDPVSLVVEAIGLTINLPAESNVVSQDAGGTPSIAVTDGSAVPVWSMRIQSLTSTLPNPSAQAHIEDYLKRLTEGKQAFDILSNDTVTYNGVKGQLCYIRQTDNKGQEFISGWLVMPSGDRQFLVAAIATLPEPLPRVRPLLEKSFATIKLQDVREVSLELRAKIESGRSFLAGLTEKQLRSLIGLKQVARSHGPMKEGGPHVERGYSVIQASEATRKVFGGADDGVTGLLLTIYGRTVQNAERHIYIDTRALYWVKWDLSEEQWSMTATRRQGDAEQSQAETAILTPATTGSPVPKLTVIVSAMPSRSRDPYEWEVPDVYMPQAIGWVLGKLLPRDPSAAKEYRWYAYTSAGGAPAISQRSDTWRKAAGSANQWELVTRLTVDTQPFTSIYDTNGNLLRRTYADGSMTEPSSVEEIEKLWKRQGLQVGRSD